MIYKSEIISDKSLMYKNSEGKITLRATILVTYTSNDSSTFKLEKGKQYYLDVEAQFVNGENGGPLTNAWESYAYTLNRVSGLSDYTEVK